MMMSVNAGTGSRRETTPTGSRQAATRGAAKARNARSKSLETEELDQVFDSVARYFSLLAEPTRLRILHTICAAERSVSQIVEATGATQTNVSRHLSMMHRAGVVCRRREGSAVYYQILDPEITEICRTVCVRIASRIEAGEPLRRDLLDFANGTTAQRVE